MYNLLRVVESAVLEKQTTVQYHGKNAIPLPTSNIIWYLAFKNAKKKTLLKKCLKTLKKMHNDIFERFFEYHVLKINGSTSFLWPWEPVWRWDIFHVFAFSFSFIFLIRCTYSLKPPHPPTPYWEIPETNRGFSSRFRSIYVPRLSIIHLFFTASLEDWVQIACSQKTWRLNNWRLISCFFGAIDDKWLNIPCTDMCYFVQL